MECSICLDMFNGEIYTTDCKHSFHLQCLRSWLVHNNMCNQCPICRANIVISKELSYKKFIKLSGVHVKYGIITLHLDEPEWLEFLIPRVAYSKSSSFIGEMIHTTIDDSLVLFRLPTMDFVYDSSHAALIVSIPKDKMPVFRHLELVLEKSYITHNTKPDVWLPMMLELGYLLIKVPTNKRNALYCKGHIPIPKAGTARCVIDISLILEKNTTSYRNTLDQVLLESIAP